MPRKSLLKYLDNTTPPLRHITLLGANRGLSCNDATIYSVLCSPAALLRWGCRSRTWFSDHGVIQGHGLGFCSILVSPRVTGGLPTSYFRVTCLTTPQPRLISCSAKSLVLERWAWWEESSAWCCMQPSAGGKPTGLAKKWMAPNQMPLTNASITSAPSSEFAVRRGRS
jgi:hypothetical protein